ncbi:uncharacterized protein LOC128200747 [Galleria mellonella]|uniref:Uncharacterized protein LOC128200747 n=1 Tax=Galleria mellonella TaxID=7137 RepID=A0ABM3MIR9_GALME|nr:uncharacterized protein LOC128200747 [Galleria mellonella]
MAGVSSVYIILFNIILFVIQHETKTIQYFSTERPSVYFLDTQHIEYFNISSRRHGRNDPFYYVDIHLCLHVAWGNNYTVSFYFYEFLTNQYKRGFIEMHTKVCDLIHKNNFFGAPMRKYFPSECPIPGGAYHLYNMTIPIEQVPRGFPFTKGLFFIAYLHFLINWGKCSIERAFTR